MSTATAESLILWVNTFGEGTCCSLAELSSGTLIYKCMKNVIPELGSVSSGNGEEWRKLLAALTEFCGCSLEYSVDTQLLEEGDEEQIARVVVLLLCLSVQRKSNEKIISRITTLGYTTQRDLMYYIEEALAKINSNALSTGNFTSGMGNIVPPLEDNCFPPSKEEKKKAEMVETPTKLLVEGTSENATLIQLQQEAEHLVTPQRPIRVTNSSTLYSSKLHCSQNNPSYYRGLESPAAIRWMRSHAFSHDDSPFANKEREGTNKSSALPEELYKLRHKVRVLEKSLENERTLSAEFYNDLCQLEQKHWKLEADFQVAQRSVEEVQQLKDIQEELDVKSCALEKTEKTLQRCQRELEELRCYRKKCQELEDRADELTQTQSKKNELQERLEETLIELVDKNSEIRRLIFGTEKASLAAKAMEQERKALLQRNEEYSYEIHELKQHVEAVQQELLSLQDSSAEKEQSMAETNQTLSLQLQKAESRISELQSVLSSLKCANASTQRALKDEQDQRMIYEEEMAALRASLEEELAQERAELKGREEEVQEWKKEWTKLKSELISLRGKIIDLEEELTKVEKERERLKMEEEKLGREKEGLKEEVEKLEREREGLRDEEKKLEEERDRARDEEVKLRRELCSLQKKLVVLEEEKKGLREEGEVFSDRLQAQSMRIEERECEWVSKMEEMEREMAQLTQELGEARASLHRAMADMQKEREEVEKAKREAVREREEAERKRKNQENDILKLKQHLEVVMEEKERWRKEVEVITQHSQDNLLKIEEKYMVAMAKVESGHQLYCREVQELREINVTLQQQVSEQAQEGDIFRQRQTDLQEQLCSLQESKDEIAKLCQEYELAYKAERERSQALREEMKRMAEKRSNEGRTVVGEVNSLREHLSREKHTITRLGSENRTLKAQVSFLEQKLRDLEVQKCLFPPFTTPSHSNLHHSTASHPPTSPPSVFSAHKPHTTEDLFLKKFYSLKSELTSLTEGRENVSSVENASSQLDNTAGKERPAKDEQCMMSAQLKAPKDSGWASDRARISELAKRNRNVLPHLKSSYAVELQEQVDSPSISHERIKSGREGKKEHRAHPPSNLAISLSDSHQVPSLPTSISTEGSGKSSVMPCKNSRDQSSSESLLFTSSKVNAQAMTPQTPCLHLETEREQRKCTIPVKGNMQDQNEVVVENQVGSMFELTFSPPKKAAPPKCLRQRLEKQPSESVPNPAPLPFLPSSKKARVRPPSLDDRKSSLNKKTHVSVTVTKPRQNRLKLKN